MNMIKLIDIYCFFLALILGSFFNVVGLRVPLNKSIVKPRSACQVCGNQLGALELIPVLSYIIQRGKCRSCKSRISPIYPITELITGLLFLMAPVFIGWTSELYVAWALISLFMIIFVSDIHYMLIPDKILIVFAGVFLFERLLWPLTPWWDSILGAIIGFMVLLAIALVSKGGMGGGDVKLFALIGFVLGTKLLFLSFFLSTLYGALFGVFALLIKLVKRREPIPFGPFIGAGTLTAYFYGDQIIEMYLHFITSGL